MGAFLALWGNIFFVSETRKLKILIVTVVETNGLPSKPSLSYTLVLSEPVPPARMPWRPDGVLPNPLLTLRDAPSRASSHVSPTCVEGTEAGWRYHVDGCFLCAFGLVAIFSGVTAGMCNLYGLL